MPPAGRVLLADHLPNSVGESPSGKAAAFGAAIRRFESFLPSHRVPPARRLAGLAEPAASRSSPGVLIPARCPPRAATLLLLTDNSSILGVTGEGSCTPTKAIFFL